MVHIEKMPGPMSSMTIQTLLPGKPRLMLLLDTNTGSKRTRLLKKEARNSCRPAQKAVSGAMIQIDSLLGMTSKPT
jgi:hypothetical protein